MALNRDVTGTVSYTTIGNPSNVDGVVSGFDYNNYISTSTPFSPSSSSPWEMTIKIKTGSETASGQTVFISNYNNNWGGVALLIGDERFTFAASTTSTNSWYCVLNSAYGSALTNTIYWFKFGYDLTKFYFSYSTDGNNYTSIGTYASNSNLYSPLNVTRFGSYNDVATPFLGSIDFNETYIIVNNSAWVGVCKFPVKHINYGTAVGYTNAGNAVISATGILTTTQFVNGGLILPALTTDFNTFEVQLKCTGFNGTTSDRYQRYLVFRDSSVPSIRFGIYQYTSSDGTSGYIYIQARDVNTDTFINDEIYPSRPPNEQYIIKAVSNGTTSLVVTITDWSGNLLKQKTYSGAFQLPSTTDQNTLGYYNNQSRITGSIDLNETYVKGNGSLWFYRPTLNYVVKDDKLVFADRGLYLSGPVTYTKTGTGTAQITEDGIAGPFSTGWSLRTSSPFPTQASSFEVVTKIKLHPMTVDKYFLAGDNRSSFILGLKKFPSDYTLEFWGGNASGTSSDWYEEFTISAADYSWIYVKFVYDGTSFIGSYGIQKDSWTVGFTRSASNPLYGNQAIYIGKWPVQNTAYSGYIDLNETYIKVNGSLWFYGKNYASQNIATVPSGLTYGTTTTPDVGFVDMRTQTFTAAPSGATLGKDS